MSRIKVCLVFGTRPETLKLAPVHAELLRRDRFFEPSVVVTGQHREMLHQALGAFGISPHANLDVMVEGQTLTHVTCSVLAGLETVLRERRPDIILVQGDTTTVFAASLAAFYQRIKVGHVEAGLRTGNRFSPYPEEINRRLTGQLADLHFAATARARDNLRASGIADSSIFVTGNTIVDAVREVAGRAAPLAETEFAWADALAGKLVLVTAHRRENLGVGLVAICEALRRIVADHPEVTVLYAMHPNPPVRATAHEVLGDAERVILCDPPDYPTFVRLMQRSDFIITDSGGIQEEAPALGIPVLVARDTTERPEGVEAGVARLVGADTDAIVAAARELLTSPSAYQAMAAGGCPYGDGHAAERICDALEFAFGVREERPEPFVVP